MNHKTHIMMMVGLTVAAAVLFSTGYGGSWVLLALLGVCAVMMVSMMVGMGGGRDRDGMDGDRSEGSGVANPRSPGRKHH